MHLRTLIMCIADNAWIKIMLLSLLYDLHSSIENITKLEEKISCGLLWVTDAQTETECMWLA